MNNLSFLPVSRRFARHVVLGAAATLLATVLPAQTAAETPPPAPSTAPAPAEAGGAPDGATRADRANRRANAGNFNPAEMQARMLDNLRKQLDVPDDAEWALISERVTKVFEMRRNQLVSGFAGAAGARLAGRFGGQADPEADALRAAITDKLPDAEIKARLTRLRDARKQNEAKLDQAREDLRAVLSVRQEAVLVMAGLLN